MKKTVSLLLALVMAASLLAACGKTGGTDKPAGTAAVGTAAIESYKTLGEVFAAAEEGYRESAYSETEYVFAFQLGDTYYRVIAALPQDVSTALWALDDMAEDKDAKENELLSPLPIDKYENLSEGIPAQEELDKWVGKTCADLLNDDFTSSGWDLEKMEFWFHQGVYAYTVTCDGQVEDYDSFTDDDLNPLVIKSVVCTGIGDGTYTG